LIRNEFEILITTKSRDNELGSHDWWKKIWFDWK